MPTQWLKNLSHKAAHVKMLSPVYDLSLGNLEEPLQFSSFPVDIIEGDAGRGRWAASGKLDINGYRVPLDMASWLIGSQYQDTLFFEKLHGFEFGSELKSLGGHEARKALRDITSLWCTDFKPYHHVIWSPALSARRLVNWMIVYPFAFETAPDDFLNILHQSFYRQYRHIENTLATPAPLDDFDRMAILWALIIIQCHCDSFYNKMEMDSYILLFKGVLNDLILADGGLFDRNPQNALELLHMILIVKQSLQIKGGTIPLWLSLSVDKLTRFIVGICHVDKNLPSFQGATLPNKNNLEKIIRATGHKIRRQDRVFDDVGYTSMRKGKTSIIIDHGNFGGSHTAPMAIEIAHAGHRLISCCGTHFLDKNWEQALSDIAAHSTAEIGEVNPQHATVRPKAELEKLNSDVLFVGSHEQYRNNFNTTHTRRIYMDKMGEDIRGEDIFIRDISIQSLPVTLRFHLHPSVKASVVNDGRDVLLKIANGTGWMFQCHSDAPPRLEDSVFCGNGMRIKKTSQIVISLPFNGLNDTIKWAFKKI